MIKIKPQLTVFTNGKSRIVTYFLKGKVWQGAIHPHYGSIDTRFKDVSNGIILRFQYAQN